MHGSDALNSRMGACLWDLSLGRTGDARLMGKHFRVGCWFFSWGGGGGEEELQGTAAEAYLVNDWAQVELEWLVDATTVGVTAGASAPEHLVQQIIESLQLIGYSNLEEVEMIEEDVRFSLPPELGAVAAQLVSITR